MTDGLLFETGKTSLRRSLAIQARVVHALLMRELITRYGRDNIGFLWMFAEPILFIGGMAALRSVLERGGAGDVPVIPFVLTGWSGLVLWRNMATQCMNGIVPNLTLLFHRNVTMIDLFYARMILEGASASVSFLVLLVFFISFDWIDKPDDVMVMLAGWFLLFWFGCGFGLIVAVIGDRSEPFKRMWGLITLALMMISGVFFMVDWLPKVLQEAVLWLPMVHGLEMMRKGYFGGEVVAHYDVSYIATANLVLLYFGMLLVDRTKHRLGTR